MDDLKGMAVEAGWLDKAGKTKGQFLTTVRKNKEAAVVFPDGTVIAISVNGNGRSKEKAAAMALFVANACNEMLSEVSSYVVVTAPVEKDEFTTQTNWTSVEAINVTLAQHDLVHIDGCPFRYVGELHAPPYAEKEFEVLR